MPFDLEKLTGTWKTIRSSDNYREILQKMGVQTELVGYMVTTEDQLEVTGNTVTSKRTVFGKSAVNNSTQGVVCEETDASGTKRKWEGDTKVSHYPRHDGKGLVVHLSRRFIDDKTMRTEFKIGNLEGWMDSQKIEIPDVILGLHL